MPCFIGCCCWASTWGPPILDGSPRWGWKAARTGWMGWGQQGQGFGAEFNALHKLSHSILLEFLHRLSHSILLEKMHLLSVVNS